MKTASTVMQGRWLAFGAVRLSLGGVGLAVVGVGLPGRRVRTYWAVPRVVSAAAGGVRRYHCNGAQRTIPNHPGRVSHWCRQGVALVAHWCRHGVAALLHCVTGRSRPDGQPPVGGLRPATAGAAGVGPALPPLVRVRIFPPCRGLTRAA